MPSPARPVDRAEAPRDSRHPVDASRRHQEAERRGNARARRADDAPDAEAARDFAGVEGAATAGREQGELARVAPALGHVHARSGRHILVDDRMDTPRGLGDRELDLAASGRSRLRPLAVDRHRAPRRSRRRESRARDGVGHRPVPRPSVARGTGAAPALRARP